MLLSFWLLQRFEKVIVIIWSVLWYMPYIVFIIILTTSWWILCMRKVLYCHDTLLSGGSFVADSLQLPAKKLFSWNVYMPWCFFFIEYNGENVAQVRNTDSERWKMDSWYRQKSPITFPGGFSFPRYFYQSIIVLNWDSNMKNLVVRLFPLIFHCHLPHGGVGIWLTLR